MNKLWLAAACAALVLGAGTADAAGLAPAKTTIVHVKAASLKSTAVQYGYCWTESIASRRPDAFRCMVGNEIHDPCFTLNSKTVACPVDLRANTGIHISLTKPLPQPNPKATPNAWTMQIAGGATCNVGTGTVIPGYPFYCSGNLVCAAPDTSKPAAAIFVACGTPKSAVSVTGVGKYVVTVLYE